ncbi:MAG TPA: hypothetical protein VEJ88_00315 [Dissulfurispiraceae bacterium]|nr:hypothetical protein [Dissulfurispiraceae bacterium]
MRNGNRSIEDQIDALISEGKSLAATQVSDFLTKGRVVDVHLFRIWRGKVETFFDRTFGKGSTWVSKFQSEINGPSLDDVNHCLSMLEVAKSDFIDGNILPIRKDRKSDESASVIPFPDVSAVIQHIQGLESCLKRRWVEAQRCQSAGCYFAAIVLIGSILEGLLFARFKLDPNKAASAKIAQGYKFGITQLERWGLDQMLKVAVELGWIKKDRGQFGDALRRSRNVVHPIVELKGKANFDESTCRVSWEVLKGAIEDLLVSVS